MTKTYKEIKNEKDYHCYKLPVGKYYVGDPVYVIPEDDWKTFLETYGASDVGNGFFQIKYNKILIINNRGDGELPLFWNQNDEDEPASYLGIDSGMFAFIPFDYLTQECGRTKEYLLDFGVIMTLDYEGCFWMGEDGEKPSAEELETIDVELWDYTMCEFDGYTIFMDHDAKDAYLAIGK